MARTTVANVIERCRRQLASSLRNEVNTLGASLDATETVVTLTYDLPAGLTAGSILSVGKELMRVVAISAPAKEATVIRGWQDSDGETHATGDEVMINPRFTRYDIYDAIVDEISSWEPNLYYVESYQWAVAQTDETVELPASMADSLGVVEVRRQWTQDDDNTSWPTIDWRIMRGTVGTWDLATTSGLVIRLMPNHGYMRAGSVHALIARPFDVTTAELVETDDLVTDMNLSQSMIDLLVLGVKMRLMGDDEHGRSGRFTQDEPRRTEEVPVGSALTVAQTLRSTYNRRMGDEMRKLGNKYRMRSW